MAIFMSGKHAFIAPADRKALYKFPGKGTEKQINLGATSSMRLLRILSVIVSIYVGSSNK
jgi:hypothetical protein